MNDVGRRDELALPASFGRFELLTKLGAGAMATVYLARVTGVGGFERLFAIKVCHPHLQADETMVKMFLDEARIASGILHSNVVATHDVSPEPHLHLVMDYVPGGSLHDLLKAADHGGRALPQTVALRIAHDVLCGLHAAHEHPGPDGVSLGIVHRDVSPHNILLGVDGSVRVADFGVAWARERLTQTTTGTIKGKFGYKAPEVLQGARTADRRADVFAVGVVLWEMLAMRRLYSGDSPNDVVAQILSGKRQRLETFGSTPKSVSDAVDRCLAAWPSRAPSAADAAQAIANAGTLATPAEVGRCVAELLGAQLQRVEDGVRSGRAAAERLNHETRYARSPDRSDADSSAPDTLVSGPPAMERAHAKRAGWVVLAALGLLVLTALYQARTRDARVPESHARGVESATPPSEHEAAASANPVRVPDRASPPPSVVAHSSEPRSPQAPTDSSSAQEANEAPSRERRARPQRMRARPRRRPTPPRPRQQSNSPAANDHVPPSI